MRLLLLGMRIGFDASDCVTGRADGTTRYTRELAARLPMLAREDSWQFFAPGNPKHLLWDQSPPNVLWRKSPWPRFWTQSRLPFDLYRYPCDVLFMPIQQLPILRPRHTRTVAVIHDLAFHEFGDQFTYVNWMLLHAFTSQTVREADHIIAVSKSTADDIERLYGRRNNVHVIWHGVHHAQFVRPDSRVLSEAGESLRTAIPGLRRSYILFVGQVQPRKNLARLVQAFELMESRWPNVQLVVAGGHGWLNQPIYQLFKESRRQRDILVTGTVDEACLASLYWHAEALVLPSLYEGFGLPVLEAMAAGCPVVAADSSSLREIVSSAGVLVDPYDPRSIAEGIAQALRTPAELRAKGLQHVASFTWDKTARETLAVLEAAQQDRKLHSHA